MAFREGVPTTEIRSGDRVIATALVTFVASDQMITLIDPFIVAFMKDLTAWLPTVIFTNPDAWKDAFGRVVVITVTGLVTWLHMLRIRLGDAIGAGLPVHDDRTRGIGGRPLEPDVTAQGGGDPDRIDEPDPVAAVDGVLAIHRAAVPLETPRGAGT